MLAARTAKLGADHLDTVATKHNLAALYLAQGKYALAEALYKEVLAVRTAKLGADHPDTLTSRHTWPRCTIQGKYALAEALYKEVLAARTAKLGADHPSTLASQHEVWPGCTIGRGSTPRPRRCTRRCWRPVSPSWGPTTASSSRASTTWPAVP